MAGIAEALRVLARKYVWWKTPDQAIASPQRVIAQVMNIGDFEDVQAMAALVGNQTLRHVLAQAEIGQFDERSWVYWHIRLGLSSYNDAPPMPMRRFE